MSKSYFFLTLPEPISSALFDTAPWDDAVNRLARFAREWCPVCDRRIKDSEIHMIDESGCTRITGLATNPLSQV